MDAQLLEQFSAMGTTDRDVLIRDFQLYVGGRVDLQGSAFFLEMNSWNLQNAVGAFFELQAKNDALPGMSLVADMTIGEGESVSPETLFTKLWRVRNTGTTRWPAGCYLAYIRGDEIGPCTKVNMPCLTPGRMADVHISMLAPQNDGHFCSEWRMCMADGTFFGDTVWVIIQVAHDGLLDLTQQMSSLTTGAENSPSSFCSVTLVDIEAQAVGPVAAAAAAEPMSLAALQASSHLGRLDIATDGLSQVDEAMLASLGLGT